MIGANTCIQYFITSKLFCVNCQSFLCSFHFSALFKLIDVPVTEGIKFQADSTLDTELDFT